ncbi:MAG: FGGY-family carbohydrate kinase [Sulfuriflexus sp.]|nr:FGGY-family carbohydrate kinase [Sulfuriflexus sp.]
MSLFIGIDLGTSACRVAVLDAQEQLLSFSNTPLPDPISEGLTCEQSPNDWWQACQISLQEALQGLDAQKVSSIAVDGTSSTLLLCDATGQVTHPALMYRDQRAQQQANVLADIAPATTAVHSPSSSLAKLLWMQSHDQLKVGLKALHQADWISGKLRGEYDHSDENNALKLGYDPVNRQWPDWLHQLDLPMDCLPTVVPAGTVLGTIHPDIAAQFGFSTDCQIVSGTTDSTATFIASGAHRLGDALTVLGSTLAIKILADKPIYAPEYGIYSHRLGDQYLVGGASNTGGAVLRQFFDDQQLEQLSAQIELNKPVTLEYMPLPSVGERFPVNNPDLEPLMTPRPADDVDFLHALLESMSKIELQGYAALSKLGAPMPTSIRSSGGGAKNPQWQALRQKQLNVTFLKPSHQEAAVGAALLASRA